MCLCVRASMWQHKLPELGMIALFIAIMSMYFVMKLKTKAHFVSFGEVSIIIIIIIYGSNVCVRGRVGKSIIFDTQKPFRE